LRDEKRERDARGQAGMKTSRRVVITLVAISAAVVSASLEVRHHRARTETLAATHGFSGKRAFHDLEELVKLGPRPPGSQALEEGRKYITRQLSAAGAEVRDDSFVASTPVGNISMTNIIGVIQGDSDSVVMVGGHYDTAKLDGEFFMGANDGGSSTAFLLEMARVLAHRKNRFIYWVVFFDGEEALKQWSPSDSLYGSRQLAEKLAGDGTLKRVRALILVDMVADRHLDILRESNSTPWLSDLVFNSARQLGYERFWGGGTFPVEDDHLPFMREGVQAVDIIDLTPFKSYHHTALDAVDKCSPESLAVVGRVVMVTLAQLEHATGHCHMDLGEGIALGCNACRL
jgi:Zn-dependent M28 family amino/carboxypeptidase